MHTYGTRRWVAATGVALAVCLGAGIPVPRALAAGESSSELQRQADAAQDVVRQKVAAYNEALSKVQDLDARVQKSQEDIDGITGRLPQMRDRAARSLREQYKMDQDSTGLVGLLLCSEDFESLVANLRYMDGVTRYHTQQVHDLITAQDQLETAKATLEVQRSQAAEESEAANQALADAQQAAADLQAAADAARAAEQAAAATGQAAGASSPEAAIAATNAAARQAGVDLSSDEDSPAPYNATDQAARDAFVQKWAPRLDAYLAGRPLAGQGKAFAEAAWDSCIDPRWSAATSVIESGGGAACFAPYNAYGWLARGGFDSWEQGVREHAAYLRSTYGSSFTPTAAAIYLLGDPTATTEANDYYLQVVAEIARI